MRLGIVSDSHGGHASLQRVLDLMGPIDALIHAGDCLSSCGFMAGVPGFVSACSGEDARQGDPLPALQKAGKLWLVRGNCDSKEAGRLYGLDLEEQVRLVDWEGWRIYLTHGHLESFSRRLAKAKAAEAHVLIYGHSHVKELFEEDGVLCLNPGSPSRPRDGVPSYALLEGQCFSLHDARTGERLAQIQAAAPGR